jgi:hypothetical protein
MKDIEEIKKQFDLVITRRIPSCLRADSIVVGNHISNFILDVDQSKGTMVQAFKDYPPARIIELKKSAIKVW